MDPVVDLNEYLQRLSEHSMLLRVDDEVNPIYELAKRAVEAERKRESALVFSSVRGSSMPVASNLYSEQERVAMVFGKPSPELSRYFLEAMSAPVKPTYVNSASVQELREESLDSLPIPHHSPSDGGRYISGGVLTAFREGRRAMQFARVQVKDSRRLAVRIDPGRTIRGLMKDTDVLDVAIAIGAPPAVEYAAAVRGLNFDKLDLAGALQHRPIEVVKCAEVDCEVPARSQVVIEGVMKVKELEQEGPFGEFTGYSSPSELMPIVECKTVTRRSDGVFRTIVGGSLEHVMLNNVAREAAIYQILVRAVPGVLDVHLPASGCGFIAFLSVKEDYVHEAKNALLAALSAHPIVKYAIVVDEDIDVRDERQVLWALATRSGGDQDLVVAPRTYDHVMDPGSDNGFVNKLGIDATFPPEKKGRYRRVKYG